MLCSCFSLAMAGKWRLLHSRVGFSSGSATAAHGPRDRVLLSAGVRYLPRAIFGSGAVLGTLRPKRGVGSVTFAPLIEIWTTLRDDPDLLKQWYAERYLQAMDGDKVREYERIKESYNHEPNGQTCCFCAALLCGRGRFRQADGTCPLHAAAKPISPQAFARRVDEWYRRTRGAEFLRMDYREAMAHAKRVTWFTVILPTRIVRPFCTGLSSFSSRSACVIADCKRAGFLSRSASMEQSVRNHICHLPIPEGLFEREVLVNADDPMLRGFRWADRH
jgi:DNA adenine methylase